MKNRKGITFVEVLISISVLIITVTASSAVCISYLGNRTAIKRYQENTEELSLAINQLSKEIRMSNCESGGCVFSDRSITLKSNYSKDPVTYMFYEDSNSKELRRDGVAIASNVVGNFSFFKTSNDNTSIGRITMVLMKTNKVDGAWKSKPETAVQTTVSMRSGYNN